MGINDYEIAIQGKLFYITVKTQNLKSIEYVENLNQEQIRWMIKGAYLGAGSINNPEKKYHLEIGIAQKNNAEKVIEYLKVFDLLTFFYLYPPICTVFLRNNPQITADPHHSKS